MNGGMDVLELVTSILDLVGLLLVVVAVSVLVASWSIPASIAAGGVGVLAVSWLIDHRRKAG